MTFPEIGFQLRREGGLKQGHTGGAPVGGERTINLQRKLMRGSDGQKDNQVRVVSQKSKKDYFKEKMVNSIKVWQKED